MAVQNLVRRQAGRGVGTRSAGRADAPAILRDSTLVVEYTFAEGSGAVVNNRVYPIPNDPNLIAFPEQSFAKANGPGGTPFSNGSVTVTENTAASPAGDTTASRVQAAAGSLKTLTQPTALTAQTYTLSLWVQSNTGNAEKFRLQIGTANRSTDQTTPTSGWNLYTYGATGVAGTQQCGIISDVASDAFDVLVWGMRLEATGTATNYRRPVGRLVLGAGTAAPTWTPRGLSFSSASSQYAGGMFAQAPSFTTCSFYVAFKRTANPNPSSGFNFLLGGYNNSNNVRIATADGANQQNQWSGGGLQNALTFCLNSQFFGSGILDPYDGNWHVLACVYDGANGLTYLDGFEFARTANASVGTFTQQYWYLGNNGATRYNDDEIGYLLAYSAAHTAAQVQANTKAIGNVLVGRGVPPGQVPDGAVWPLVIWDGDSIIGGAGLGVSGWPAQTHVQLSPVPYGRVPAITGSMADFGTSNNDLAHRRSDYLHKLLSPRRRANVVHLHAGANDLNTASASVPKGTQYLKEVCQSYKALGANVKSLLVSCLPNSRAGRGNVFGTSTLDDDRDYASNASLYTSSWNYQLRNGNAWSAYADAFADVGYGNVDAVVASVYFASSSGAGSGAAGTVTLSGGAVNSVSVDAAGSGYTQLLIPRIFGGNGSGATLAAHMKLLTATKSAGGSGYTQGDTLTLTGCTGTAPQFTVNVSAGAVTSVLSITVAGDCTGVPTGAVGVTGGTGTGATFTLTWGMLSIGVTAGGSGYTNTGIVSPSVPYGAWTSSYANSGTFYDSVYWSDGTHPTAALHTSVATNFMLPKVQGLL